MQDCEWKVRTTQRTCKQRIVEAEQAREDALKKAVEIEAAAAAQIEKVSVALRPPVPAFNPGFRSSCKTCECTKPR